MEECKNAYNQGKVNRYGGGHSCPCSGNTYRGTPRALSCKGMELRELFDL